MSFSNRKKAAVLLFSMILAGACEDPDTLAKSYINPAAGYSQVVAVQAEGTKTLYVSGQVGSGATREEQMRSALENLRTQLEAGGATYRDIVKMNTYIVDYQPAFLDTFRNVRQEMMGNVDMPASTLVGVESLAVEDWLIEIEAIAVLPASDQ